MNKWNCFAKTMTEKLVLYICSCCIEIEKIRVNGMEIFCFVFFFLYFFTFDYLVFFFMIEFTHRISVIRVGKVWSVFYAFQLCQKSLMWQRLWMPHLKLLMLVAVCRQWWHPWPCSLWLLLLWTICFYPLLIYLHQSHWWWWHCLRHRPRCSHCHC